MFGMGLISTPSVLNVPSRDRLRVKSAGTRPLCIHALVANVGHHRHRSGRLRQNVVTRLHVTAQHPLGNRRVRRQLQRRAERARIVHTRPRIEHPDVEAANLGLSVHLADRGADVEALAIDDDGVLAGAAIVKTNTGEDARKRA